MFPAVCPTLICLINLWLTTSTSKTVEELPSLAKTRVPSGVTAIPPVTGCVGAPLVSATARVIWFVAVEIAYSVSESPPDYVYRCSIIEDG